MHSRAIKITLVSMLLAIALLAACSSSDNPTAPTDTTAPTVVSTDPATGAVNVAAEATVTVTFSEAMDPATATQGNVTMTGGDLTETNWTNSRTLSIEHLGWTGGAQVAVTLGTGLTDTAGNHLAAASNISFTVVASDTTAPTVADLIPSDGAIDVAATAPVTVVFSEPMQPTGADSAVVMTAGTITSAIWTSPDTLQIQHDGWAAGATVTVTVGPGLHDLAGNDLATAVSAAFTVADPDLTAPTLLTASPVDGATDVPPNGVVTFVFSEAMDQGTTAGNVIMTGGTVSGLAWSDDHTLVVSHADWTTKSLVSVTVGVGLADLAGNHLTEPSTTTFSVTVPDTTPPTLASMTPTPAENQVATDQDIVLVFSEAMQPATGTGLIDLDVGTITSLVWSDDHTLVVHHTAWPNSATIQVTVHTTLLDLAGNAFAGTNWGFITVGDTTAPNVLSMTPTVAETGVGLDTDLTIVFSEAIDQTTVTGNVALNVGTITGADWSDDHTVNLHHDTWPAATQVTVTVLAAVQDLAGNQMGHNVSWLFTTGTSGDTTAPTVVDRSPAVGAVQVPYGADVIVTFSEPMDTTSAAGNLTLNLGTLTGHDWLDDHTVAYHHWNFGSAWQVVATVETGFTDLAGNHLSGPVGWTFRALDEISPSVVSLTPADGASDVAVDAPVNIVFSEPMDQTTAAANISLTGGITSLEWTDASTVVVHHPDWTGGAAIQLLAQTIMTDLYGNALLPGGVSRFTVVSPDLTPPSVDFLSPADGAVDVPSNQAVVIGFDEPMDQSTAAGNISMSEGTIDSLQWSGDGTLVVTHSDWIPGHQVTVTVATGMADLAGNNLTAPVTTTFTVTNPDATPPTIISFAPANGALDVPPIQDVIIEFSEIVGPLDAPGLVTMTGGTITNLDRSGPTTLTIHHDPWNSGSTVTVTISGRVVDLAGNAMGTPASTTFTVGAADITAPELPVVSPAVDSVGVDPAMDVTLHFSEAVDRTSVANNLDVGVPITAIDWPDDQTAVVHHDSWPYATLISATVNANVQDLAGNPMGHSVSWSFTTLTDNQSPTLVSTAPQNGDTGVAIDAPVTIVFSEAMNPSSTAGSISLSGGVTGQTWSDDHTLVLQHAPWSAGWPINLVVDYGMTDLAGNHLTNSPHNITFTTLGTDSTPPTVISTDPADGAAGVVLDPVEGVSITFSEPMATTSVGIVPDGGYDTYDNDTRTLHINGTWPAGATETISVNTSTTDLAGNHLAAEFSLTITMAGGDTTPPTVTGFTPTSGTALDTGLSEISITFSEAIDPNSLEFAEINGQLLTQLDAGGPVWSAGGTVVSLPLRTMLPAGVAYHLVVGSYADLAGNFNAASDTWDAVVAGTADEYPVDDTLRYDFGTQDVDNISPVWDGTWHSFSRESVMESATDFRRLRLDTPASTPTDWDYMTKTSTLLQFRGFREHDEQAGTDDDNMFVPPVDYMHLPLVEGDVWSGTATISTPGGDVDLNYSGEVFSGTDDVEIPDALQGKSGGAKTTNRRFWSGCHTMRLYHDMITSTGDTMEVGVDTLQVVPGIGIVRESNSNQDFTDSSWSWDNNILFAIKPINP